MAIFLLAGCNLRELLSKSTLNNLFDTHPPFQIDGNFGGTAGIAEMLIQSHGGIITLLPAIPSSWREGEVKGLCARGGFMVNMKWADSSLEKAEIFSETGGKCTILYNGTRQDIILNAGQKKELQF